MTHPLPMHPQRLQSDTALILTPSWEGILVVDVESGGLMTPLLGMLQRQGQTISRQSKAARAGEQGEGFGVVADSAEAAERTDLLARAMAERVGRSRESAARTLSTLQTVNDATHHGRQSFLQVEQGVIGAEKWSGAIESAVADSGRLVVDMTERLDILALGTQRFASAMHQVAATSEEQSDSIDEIAGAASSLSSAAKRVAQLVGTFKLGDTPVHGTPVVRRAAF